MTPFLYGYWLEHGEKAIKAMGDSCAVIIRGHGAIVTGKTLKEACVNMVQLERKAKLILMSGVVGQPQSLSAAELEEFKGVAGLRARGKADPAIASFMEWSYYESLIKRGERWNRL